MSNKNATIRLTNSICQYSNQNKHAGEIPCGLKKTCEILLAELHFYGIKGTCKNWFTSHPTDKKQNVEIKSNETQISPIGK
jgi:hypothetical protein